MLRARNRALSHSGHFTPSRDVGPSEEGWKVPHWHMVCEGLHAQVAVFRDKHGLPVQLHGSICLGTRQVTLKVKKGK